MHAAGDGRGPAVSGSGRRARSEACSPLLSPPLRQRRTPDSAAACALCRALSRQLAPPSPTAAVGRRVLSGAEGPAPGRKSGFNSRSCKVTARGKGAVRNHGKARRARPGRGMHARMHACHGSMACTPLRGEGSPSPSARIPVPSPTFTRLSHAPPARRGALARCLNPSPLLLWRLRRPAAWACWLPGACSSKPPWPAPALVLALQRFPSGPRQAWAAAPVPHLRHRSCTGWNPRPWTRAAQEGGRDKVWKVLPVGPLPGPRHFTPRATQQPTTPCASCSCVLVPCVSFCSCAPWRPSAPPCRGPP